MIGVGCCMNNPKTIIIRIKIDDVVVCCVEVLSYVNVLNGFGG